MKFHQDFESRDKDVFAGRHVRDRHVPVARLRDHENTHKRWTHRQLQPQTHDLPEQMESSEPGTDLTTWVHNICGHEFEVSYKTGTYTGWSRCIGGRLADGRWPERNDRTGETRYSY